MSDQHRIVAGGVLGAIAGAGLGYLFFTDRGREIRDQLEPTVENLRSEFGRFQRALEKVGAIANEGVRVVNELGYARAESPFPSRSVSH